MCRDDDFQHLAERRQVWQDCIGNDDEHGLQRQILEAVVDAAVLRMTIKMRQLAPRAEDDSGVELNGPLFRMIDNAFFHAHTAAIRRLTDRSSPLVDAGAGRDRSVYSLAALLMDMRNHAALMTRANMIRAGEYLNEQFSWRERERHAELDWLTGASEAVRSDSDAIDVRFFDFLLERLDGSCGEIREWATKHVAHAAAPASRGELGDVSISWQSLWAAYATIADVAHTVRVWILEGAHVQIMPFMISDIATYLDRPLVEATLLDQVRQVWRGCEGETEGWLSTEEALRSGFGAYLESRPPADA